MNAMKNLPRMVSTSRVKAAVNKDILTVRRYHNKRTVRDRRLI